MRLLIDTGIDKRTVVSGIAEYFETGTNYWETSYIISKSWTPEFKRYRFPGHDPDVGRCRRDFKICDTGSKSKIQEVKLVKSYFIQ